VKYIYGDTMKVGLLAGGLGSRLSEETILKPKPMVEIGGRPILWHIMQGYAASGFREFVLALGYKAEVIKEYFLNYRLHNASFTVRLQSGDVTTHAEAAHDWTVHLLDTGLATQTGGRVREIARFVGRETFLLTYGDGVCDLDIRRLVEFHRSHGKLATVTAVRPPARFGSLQFDGDTVVDFHEKPQASEGWINGGFFVLEPKVADYIDGPDSIWEREPMERLAAEGQLVACRHDGFWQCMDTVRDLRLLENLWAQGEAPWKRW
jgi:glucose-1-phosphate cytidylyltransferase